jgi:co-chaperonin GroES (HSP10)/DNA-directed RNA polymerase subunit RPC12/RpoP
LIEERENGEREGERMPEIDLASALQTNVLKLGTMTMEAHADRLIVVQDPFVSGYECTTCGGKLVVNDVSYVKCEDCGGEGSKIVSLSAEERHTKKCSTCAGTGRVVCEACGGKGGVIIVPDASERRPTTGTIASVGNQVTSFERGESVIYPSFAGHAYDLMAEDLQGNPVDITIVLLRESEILAKISGHLEMRRVKKSAAMGTAA